MRSQPLHVLAWVVLLFATACQGKTEAPASAPTPSELPTPEEAAKTARIAEGVAEQEVVPKTECVKAKDCVVIELDCCGTCRADEAPQLKAGTQADLLAQTKLCAATAQDCQPNCGVFGVDPSYIALCIGGSCELVDLRTSIYSECETADDCQLRPPRCCGCSGEPAALAKDEFGALKAELCDEFETCNPCRLPLYSGYTLDCIEGHCIGDRS